MKTQPAPPCSKPCFCDDAPIWAGAWTGKNKEKVFETLVAMDLDPMAMRQFNRLSGGEQQKAIFAHVISASTIPRGAFEKPVIFFLTKSEFLQ